MSLDASCASVECLTVSTACRYARTLVTSADGQSDPYCFFVASRPLTTYFRQTAMAEMKEFYSLFSLKLKI